MKKNEFQEETIEYGYQQADINKLVNLSVRLTFIIFIVSVVYKCNIQYT